MIIPKVHVYSLFNPLYNLSLKLNLCEDFNGIHCESVFDTMREDATINFGVKDIIVYAKNRYNKNDSWSSMDDIDFYRSWYNVAREPSLCTSPNLYKRDVKFEYNGEMIFIQLPNDFEWIGCFCYSIDEKTNMVTLSVDQIKKVI